MEFRNAIASARTTLANILQPHPRRLNRSEAAYLRETLDGHMTTAAGQAPGTWARIVSTAGTPAGFVYRCHCGTSYPFPEQTVFERLQEKDRPQCSNRGCHARHGAFDFAGAVRLRVATPSADDPQFKALIDRFDGDITAADFVKHPDGQYWLRDEKRSRLFAQLKQIPDVSFSAESDRPLIIPTDGPDFECAYESFDPGKGSAGFAGGTNQRSFTDESEKQLPKEWLEKRARAYERHNRAYGPEAELRNLEAALAPIQDAAVRAQLRRAILRDDRDEVSQLANALASEQEMVSFMVGEGDAARMVYTRQARNVGFIYDAQANFCGRVGDKEARSLLEKVEKRDAGA